MRVFFKDTETNEVLFKIEDEGVIPNVDDTIILDNILYIVIKKTFYLNNYSCTVWIKKHINF